MLKISKLADYAMVLMHRLSCDDTQSLSAKQLADRTIIPQPTVSKVLKLLSDAHLVQSTRGVQGGYRLAYPAADISVAAVIQAIDGQFAMTECNLPINSCGFKECCELRSNWQFINDKVLALLNSITILDMQQPLSME